MLKSKIMLLLSVMLICHPAFLFCAEINEDEIVSEDESKKIYIDEEDEYSFFQRGKLNNLLAVSAGYDNNAHLNSKRNADAFIQNYFKTKYTAPISRDKTLTGILSYELMSLVYTGESDLDIIKNSVNAGVEKKINKDWEVSGGYRLDCFSYVNSAVSNFFENAAYGKVKQNLPFKMYHELGYELGYKNYPQNHIRVSAALDSDKKRDDLRNTVNYEAGKYFSKDLFKIGYEYFNNNSNEKYINYYDYDANKISTSLTHLFNDKVFGYVYFARQYRDYRSRTIVEDASSLERDKTWILAAALNYNLNKALTVGVSYTYRQNSSNEPVEKYSGSLIALSSYYRF